MRRETPSLLRVAVLAACLAFAGASGCRSADTTAPPLEYFEVLTGYPPPAPEEKLPLMIGLHGLGDTPQLFFRAFGTDMPARARMIFVQAPTAHGNGFSWFELPGSLDAISMGSVAAGIGVAGERVADLIEQLVREHAPPSRPVVFGYSQGGILSFYLAARHADEIAAAVPISGLLPRSMLDLDGTPAPTFAFHGSRDELVPLEGARATVAAFRAAGGTAELREYPHLGHRVSLALVRDAMAKLAELSGGGAAARPD